MAPYSTGKDKHGTVIGVGKALAIGVGIGMGMGIGIANAAAGKQESPRIHLGHPGESGSDFRIYLCAARGSCSHLGFILDTLVGSGSDFSIYPSTAAGLRVTSDSSWTPWWAQRVIF